MDLKELAEHHGVKVFNTREAAEAEGFALSETHRPRNVWNLRSAAQATIYKMVDLKRRGEASEVGVVLDAWSVTGCHKRDET